MKNKFLFLSAVLFAFSLVSCDGNKTIGGDDGGDDNGNGTTGKLVKMIRMVETGEEAYPTVLEFSYDDQKRISKINYDLYSDDEDGQGGKVEREKMAAEMAFTYASDKITVVNTVSGSVYNTAVMTIGSNGLISQIDSPFDNKDKIVFEYAGNRLSKSTYTGTMEIVDSDEVDPGTMENGKPETVVKPYTEVYVPEWSGNNISKITTTETIEGEKNPHVTVDEVKYSNVANTANIDANGMLEGSYGMARLFGNPGMMVNKIGDRTANLISEVSSTYYYTYTDMDGEETRSYLGHNCKYVYTTDKNGNVTKVDYTEKNYDMDGKVEDEDTGFIEITYVD